MRRSFGILTDDRLVSYSDCINKRSVRKVHYNRSLSYVVLVALVALVVFLVFAGQACVCLGAHATIVTCYMLHVTLRPPPLLIFLMLGRIQTILLFFLRGFFQGTQSNISGIGVLALSTFYNCLPAW